TVPCLHEHPVQEAEHHSEHDDQHDLPQRQPGTARCRRGPHGVHRPTSSSRTSWEGLFRERVRWLVTCWTLRPTSSQPATAVAMTSPMSPSRRVTKCSEPRNVPRCLAYSIAAWMSRMWSGAVPSAETWSASGYSAHSPEAYRPVRRGAGTSVRRGPAPPGSAHATSPGQPRERVTESVQWCAVPARSAPRPIWYRGSEDS